MALCIAIFLSAVVFSAKAHLSFSKAALLSSTYSNTPTETRAVCLFQLSRGDHNYQSIHLSSESHESSKASTNVPVVMTKVGPPSELITILNPSNGNVFMQLNCVYCPAKAKQRKYPFKV